MANPVIGRCPICNESLRVVRLDCEACGTRLEGSFTLGRFHSLTADQLEFLETFIRARGNFKDVERELGISYPTRAFSARCGDPRARVPFAGRA